MRPARQLFAAAAGLQSGLRRQATAREGPGKDVVCFHPAHVLADIGGAEGPDLLCDESPVHLAGLCKLAPNDALRCAGCNANLHPGIQTLQIGGSDFPPVDAGHPLFEQLGTFELESRQLLGDVKVGATQGFLVGLALVLGGTRVWGPGLLG